jgi:hypothetical protein
MALQSSTGAGVRRSTMPLRFWEEAVTAERVLAAVFVVGRPAFVKRLLGALAERAGVEGKEDTNLLERGRRAQGRLCDAGLRALWRRCCFLPLLGE